METFTRFLYAFLSQIFLGFTSMLEGIKTGFTQLFDMKAYQMILDTYQGALSAPEGIMAIIAILFVVIILVLILVLIYLLIRKYLKFRKKAIEQDQLLDEIAVLNEKVANMAKEKEEILAMKVSQLGLKPNESPIETNTQAEEEDVGNSDIRFSKLDQIDKEFENYETEDYGNSFDLPKLCDDFRNFAASKLRLFYKEEMVRIFISALASTRLVILQGISGTGKTSLAYAWGKFVNQDSCVTSVEPSWREKSDFLGYFNEFSKKFNETRSLDEIYTAGYDDDIHTIILDEMNLARVEYYFADLLSILEMPNSDEWLVDIVTDSWPKDPKNIKKGKLKLPKNLWYVGTINNDDSTFMVTDKVYDRAMPIDINTKVAPFSCREQESINVNASYLEMLFKEAIEKYSLSAKGEEQVRQIDDYVLEHFRIAFGNRIMKQINIFTAVYVACGGKEIEAIDYFIAKKILRKFDQLSVAFIRDEIDPFISYLNKNFGKDVMKECIEYLERVKKSI